LSNSSLFVLATKEQKYVSSYHQLGHNDLFSHTNSKVDIDDISFTLNFSFNSPLRDDLLINFLVSLFTSYKNLRSVPFNLGRMCLKQISSLFTIKSHTSLSPIRLFCPRVLTPPDMTKNSGKSSFRSSSSFLSLSSSFPTCMWDCEIVFLSEVKTAVFLFFSQSTLFLSPLGKEKIISLFTSFSHSLWKVRRAKSTHGRL